MLPSTDLDQFWKIESIDGVQIIRLRSPKTKDINYMRRTIGELLMPFSMRWNLNKSTVSNDQWDGVVWYAPSIFHGPFAKALKKKCNCKGYLIIRDIFPEWAADIGLMGRGFPYRFFDAVARYQYSVADIIGVQTIGNLTYFREWSKGAGRCLEVLQNWLADVPVSSCSISLADTPLAGRKIFVYAGNMGIAQGMEIFLDLAERMQAIQDVGFLFVGRGSDAKKIADDAKSRGLDNVLFHEEIDPDEIPGLYAQCAVGLVALDPRHKSHNIPGKFLSYMQCGLPVLANINMGNDLAGIIQQEDVGRVSEEGTVNALEQRALELIDAIAADDSFRIRCRALYLKLFSPEMAVRQIVAALSNDEVATK
jgi:glycosyltransferase involved in cell wall biosynthesis